MGSAQLLTASLQWLKTGAVHRAVETSQCGRGDDERRNLQPLIDALAAGGLSSETSSAMRHSSAELASLEKRR